MRFYKKDLEKILEETLGRRYLFLLIPNNSGSYLLKDILKKHKNVIDFGFEGQAHAQVYMPTPGFYECGRTFYKIHNKLQNDNLYDWFKIKSIWTFLWNQRIKQLEEQGRKLKYNKLYFLEKSPPNISRAHILKKQFENAYFISMIRNPYATIEGIFRKNVIKLNVIDDCIEQWIYCAEQVKNNIETIKENHLFFTYEQLVNKPNLVFDKISEKFPDLKNINYKLELNIDCIDGIAKTIKNYNDIQIKNLSNEDKEKITNRLKERIDLLNYFGYELL